MKKIILMLVINLLLNYNLKAQNTQWVYTFDTIKKVNSQEVRILEISKDFELKYSSLGDYLFKKIEIGEIIIYKDEGCKHAFEKSELDDLLYEDRYVRDTVIEFSIDSIPQQKVISKKIRTPIFPNEETGYIISQTWYLTPNYLGNWLVDKIGVHNTKYGETYFYIKNNDNKSKVSNNIDSLTWGRNIIATGKTLRGFRDFTFEETLKKLKIIDNEGKRITEKQAIETLDTMFVCYDSETGNKELIRTPYPRLIPFYFKTHLHLFFDTKTNSFSFKVLAIAPMRDIYDDNYNFLYMKPYFWIVYDDDFLKWFD